MRKIKDRSLVILIITIVGAAVLAILTMVGFSMGNRSRIVGLNRRYLDNATHSIVRNIDGQIDAGFANIRIVADLLSEGRTSKDVDVAQLREIMDNSVFDFIEFADADGWDHNVMGTKTYAGDRKYYLEGVLQGKTGLEVVFNSRATHETLLMFYAPVRYNGNETAGAVIGVYQASEKITGLLKTEFWGEPALSYLATPEGRIVACSEGFDPTEEKYTDSLPKGGLKLALPHNGWTVIQYFPESLTQTMISNANRLGYILMTVIMLLFTTVLIVSVIFLKNRHDKYHSEMQKALAREEQANKAKTTFLNNMSHDIRTPLNAITGFNDMAMRELGKDNDKVRSCLTKVSQSSETLLVLINDILEISRIEAGKIKLTEEKADIMFSFMNIKSIMKEIARESEIDLQFSFGNVDDKFVLYDSSHVTRILTNLISNAIKFNRKGGWVKVCCCQTGRRDDDHGVYVFTVEDNGTGISDEFKPHIFEQFAREQTSTVSKIPGIGLGLTMCRDLTNLLGGSITFTSTRGQGSKFTVTLPFRLQDGQDYGIPDFATRNISKTFDGKSVLLVEDNELNREIASSLLEEMGFKVTMANDGDMAVDIVDSARTGDFDIILMDIQMPTLDGYEATRQIRALGTPVSKIPIIAMTANAFEEDRQNAIAAGMDDHVAKPINPDKLTKTLEKFLNK